LSAKTQFYIQATYADGSRQTFAYTTRKAFDASVKSLKRNAAVSSIYATNANNIKLEV
jgi:hypothetical protein